MATTEGFQDIEVWLPEQASKVDHMGSRPGVGRSKLAGAYERANSRSYADLAQRPVIQAANPYGGGHARFELERTASAPDSATKDWSGSLCARGAVWLRWNGSRAAHAARPTRQYPELHSIPGGSVHHVSVFGVLLPEAGPVWAIDRGWADSERLHLLHTADAFLSRVPSASSIPYRTLLQVLAYFGWKKIRLR